MSLISGFLSKRAFSVVSPAFFPRIRRDPSQTHMVQAGTNGLQVDSEIPGEEPISVPGVDSASDLVENQQQLAADEDGDQRDGFNRFKLRPDVLKALSSLGLKKPTHIQELAIPQILKGHNCLLAAETGSGKTLAYVTPILNHIKDEEDAGLLRRASFPRVLILTPTRELVSQVLKVVKSMAHHVKIKSVGLVGGTNKKDEKVNLSAGVDVIVSTPGRFMMHRRKDSVFMGDIRFLVLDEADTLFKKDFLEEVQQIIEPIRRKSLDSAYKRQFITVSATLPRDITKAIDKTFPDIKHVTTPLLHRTPPKIKQRFIRIRSQLGSKQNHLVEFFKSTDAQKIIVFCNTIKGCEALHSFLEGENYPVLYFNKHQTFEERKRHYQDFLKEGQKILVTTDIGSRGLDTTMVDHVVMFDFPKNGIDYLHRAGRTGRIGQAGQVTSFVSNKDKILAATIERTIRMRKPMGWRPTERVLGKPTPSSRGNSRNEGAWKSHKKSWNSSKKSSTFSSRKQAKRS